MRLKASQLISAGLLSVVGATCTPVLGAEDSVQRGPVEATVGLSPETVLIGDSVELTLTVTAAPRVEVLMPTFGESLERFDILEFTPDQQVGVDGQVRHRQRYQLYASSSGEKKIPPLIIEFIDRRPGERLAPEGSDAYELLTRSLSFTVKSVVPEGAGNALRDLPAPLGSKAPAQGTSYPVPLVVIGALFIAGLAGASWWWWRGRGERRWSAYDVALERLIRLRSRPLPDAASDEAMDAFFVELSSIVRRYLEDRFALHAPELTTEEFLDIASASPDLTAPDRGFLQDFLRTADGVKFARRLPKAGYLETALSAVEHFLDQTRAPVETPHA